jgi:hypothetical protein
MRLRITCLFAALLLAAAQADAPRANFSGTWELDQSKSHSIPPDMKQTMTVVQDGDRVSVETKIVNPQGERTVKDAFVLDGKEVEFTPPPQGPNAPPAKGKRKGQWLAGGKGFYLEEEITSETPQGPSTTLVSRKWMSWPDGTISVEVIQETPLGAFSSRRAFVKAAPKSSD